MSSARSSSGSGPQAAAGEVRPSLRPLADMPAEALLEIEAVLTDFDDTLTSDGLFPSASVEAIEQLAAAGIKCAIVSGRPAGWCDLLARMLPLAAVVGENGAMAFAYDRKLRKMQREHAYTLEQAAANRKRLREVVLQRILQEVPDCRPAADQLWRHTDLAIDFAEDVGPLPRVQIERIAEIFAEEGATAKISSIHVNGWFGEHNKLQACIAWMPGMLGLNPMSSNRSFAYLGDSPNDEPMFAHFEHSIGVANVRDFQLASPPAWMASQRGGAGFCEFADMLLRARQA